MVETGVPTAIFYQHIHIIPLGKPLRFLSAYAYYLFLPKHLLCRWVLGLSNECRIHRVWHLPFPMPTALQPTHRYENAKLIIAVQSWPVRLPGESDMKTRISSLADRGQGPCKGGGGLPLKNLPYDYFQGLLANRFRQYRARLAYNHVAVHATRLRA